MINITSVHIENFQSHKDTTVNFENFVGIVGPTNQGKTAIIRSIIWCLYNTPSGADFIRHGEDFARVSVTFSNGKTVIHEKGAKSHYYILKEPGKDDVVLEHFGAGPVDLVMQFHGMRIVTFNDSEKTLNVCQQLEAPFFISESAPSKAAIIGRLAGTDVVDTAIKNSAKDLRAANQTKKILEEQLKTDKKTLESYKDVDEALEELSKGGEIAEYIRRKSEKIEEIRRIMKQIEDSQQKIAEISKILGKEEEVASAFELLACTKKLLNTNMAVSSISKVLLKCQNDTLEASKVLKIENSEDFVHSGEVLEDIKAKMAFQKTLKEMDSLYSSYLQHNICEKFAERGADADEELERAQNLASEIGKMVLKTRQIEALETQISAIQRDSASFDEKIADLETKQQEYFKEIGFCPTCQRPFRTRKG